MTVLHWVNPYIIGYKSGTWHQSAHRLLWLVAVIILIIGSLVNDFLMPEAEGSHIIGVYVSL